MFDQTNILLIVIMIFLLLILFTLKTISDRLTSIERYLIELRVWLKRILKGLKGEQE